MEITDSEDDNGSSVEDVSSNGDSSSSDSDESCSSEEFKFSKSSSEQKKHPDFQMSALHTSNTDVSFVYRDLLKDNVKNEDKQAPSASVKFGGYEKDFTPWWEHLSKKINPTNNYTIAQQAHKTAKDDGFDNWFNIALPGKINWLCGPCAPPVKESVSKSQVADLRKSAEGCPAKPKPVPSIYDRKVTTKGRRALKKERKAEKQMTTGAKWFGMKAPDMDDKLKNDMELIRMRGVLDPKRFYKNHDRRALPKYFQMGTVMDEGTDFYSSRLTKKQRKQNLVDELMADADIRQYNKRKYAELQQKMRIKQKSKPTRGHKKFKKRS